MNNSFETLELQQKGPVAWLTLNRPERLNAITPRMNAELADYFEDLPQRTETRVVVLRGAGRAFCAGLDIIEANRGGPAASNRLPDIVKAMRACPQPIIAAVHGAACGGGMAFALAADVRLAGESFKMNDAFIKVGASGCELGLSYLLPRQVGLSVASELMLTGRFIDAQRALATGLVSSVVADDQLETEAEQLAKDMLANSPMGLRRTKETLNRCLDVSDFDEVVDLEQAVQDECVKGPDFREALRAFEEKRPPRWQT